ncbi:MAG: T9SS type A sorting domain-containing protein [Flavobacteriales bacterium]
MKHFVPIVLFVLIGALSGRSAMACSCFGPQTFCQTLDPPYPEPEWWIPDAVVLAVKLADVGYGADMKVVRSFSGNLAQDQVIRVWGDCGLLCRYYINGPAVGDTVLWAIQETDLSGNWGCGTELEQPEDFQLSACGVYWLQYEGGVVSGPLTSEGAVEEIGVEDFAALVSGCLSTGLRENRFIDPIAVRQGPNGTWVSIDADGPASITIMDASGRVCLTENWSGSPVGLNGFPAGVYLVTVETREARWQRKVATQ